MSEDKHPDPQFEQQVSSILSESVETVCMNILREASTGAANRLVSIALHSDSESQASQAARFMLTYIRKDADVNPKEPGDKKKDAFDRILEEAAAKEPHKDDLN